MVRATVAILLVSTLPLLETGPSVNPTSGSAASAATAFGAQSAPADMLVPRGVLLRRIKELKLRAANAHPNITAAAVVQGARVTPSAEQKTAARPEARGKSPTTSAARASSPKETQQRSASAGSQPYVGSQQLLRRILNQTRMQEVVDQLGEQLQAGVNIAGADGGNRSSTGDSPPTVLGGPAAGAKLAQDPAPVEGAGLESAVGGDGQGHPWEAAWVQQLQGAPRGAPREAEPPSGLSGDSEDAEEGGGGGLFVADAEGGDESGPGADGDGVGEAGSSMSSDEPDLGGAEAEGGAAGTQDTPGDAPGAGGETAAPAGETVSPALNRTLDKVTPPPPPPTCLVSTGGGTIRLQSVWGRDETCPVSTGGRGRGGGGAKNALAPLQEPLLSQSALSQRPASVPEPVPRVYRPSCARAARARWRRSVSGAGVFGRSSCGCSGSKTSGTASSRLR